MPVTFSANPMALSDGEGATSFRGKGLLADGTASVRIDEEPRIGSLVIFATLSVEEDAAPVKGAASFEFDEEPRIGMPVFPVLEDNTASADIASFGIDEEEELRIGIPVAFRAGESKDQKRNG